MPPYWWRISLRERQMGGGGDYIELVIHGCQDYEVAAAPVSGHNWIAQ